MVLAQKQTHRSMEQDRKPRNKTTSINLQQRRQEYTMEKRQLISGAGKTGQLHVKE